MTHPRELGIPALHYYINEGLKECFVIDFLSDRAQNSITGHLASELYKFYRNMPKRDDYESYEEFWPVWDKFERQHLPFFEKAISRHPLSAVFGDVLGKAIHAELEPYFAELERNSK